MSMNNQCRPTASGGAGATGMATISGDRGLDHEEPLIFELGHGAVGVDLPNMKISDDRLGGLRRKGAIGLDRELPARVSLKSSPKLAGKISRQDQLK